MASMSSRVSLVTLGVRDVARSTSFYQALGFRLSEASQPGAVSFFHTDGGLLGLYGDRDLAADATLPYNEPAGFRGVTLSMNLDSREDVDAFAATWVAAGATALKAPGPTEWGGYHAYVADPDGHAWEIAHNPFFPIGPDGRPTLP